MARDKVIVTEKIYICDISGNQYAERIAIRYDSGRDSFYAIIPAYLLSDDRSVQQEQIGDGPVTITVQSEGRLYADRAQEVLNQIKIRVHQYRRAMRMKKKVIAYQVKYNEDMPFENGSGMLIDYCIGWELTIGDKKDYLIEEPCDDPNVIQCTQRYIETRLSSNDFEVMDWTEQREEFFENFLNAIEELKKRCHGFLDNKEKLILQIDTGGKLLITGGNNHAPTPDLSPANTQGNRRQPGNSRGYRRPARP